MAFWTKADRRLLGINDKEYALLAVLEKVDQVNTSVLAARANVPRVTALRLLTTLSHRGFVRRYTRRREVVWSLVPPVKIFEQLRQTLAPAAGAELPTPLSEVGTLTVYRGLEGIMETNRRMIAVAQPGERILAIEPTAIWESVAAGPHDPWVDLNTQFKKKGVLVELVAEEGYEDALSVVDPELRRTYLSIITSIHLVPKRFLDSATEVLIFRDQIFFIDWAHEVAVEIKNPSTMRVLRAMFRLLQESGRPLDVKSVR